MPRLTDRLRRGGRARRSPAQTLRLGSLQSLSAQRRSARVPVALGGADRLSSLRRLGRARRRRRAAAIVLVAAVAGGSICALIALDGRSPAQRASDRPAPAGAPARSGSTHAPVVRRLRPVASVPATPVAERRKTSRKRERPVLRRTAPVTKTAPVATTVATARSVRTPAPSEAPVRPAPSPAPVATAAPTSAPPRADRGRPAASGGQTFDSSGKGNGEGEVFDSSG